jgi:hypothetical protein
MPMSQSLRVLLTLALGFAACGEASSPEDATPTPGGASGSGASAGSSAGASIAGGGIAQAGTGGSVAEGGTSGGSEGGAGDAGEAGAGGAEPEPLRPPFDWVGIVGTGQSLSVGATAGTISLEQPYRNLGLQDSGPDPKYPLSGGAPKWSLVPLAEPVRPKSTGKGPGYDDGQYPNNISGETPNSGMANTLSWLWKERGGAGDFVSVHSIVGWSGNKLLNIDKTGGKRAYPATLSEARVFKTAADAQGKTFGYGAIIMTHGESDASTAKYGEGLYQLLKDYNTDLKAITGQTSDIVMLVSQQSTKATGSAGSAVQVFRAGVDHPGEIICTGPKYQYQYSGDRLHLGAAGYRRLGEKYAQVFDRVVNLGESWQPLGPTAAKRSGNVIGVTFHVPEPPLVWSTHLAAPHQTVNKEWAKGRGFEVTTNAGVAVTISAAAIEGDTVWLTLQNPPATTVPLIVSYALTQDGDNNQGGNVLGLRGLLRDSDPFVGADTESIEVNVTQGQNVITSVQKGAFRRRTGFDIISEAGASKAVVVRTRDSDDQLTLSGPWTEATGKRTLSFHYDLYNYAVHFSMPVK